MSTASPIDPAWQAEWKQAYAAPLAPRESSSEATLLAFMLGRETYALPVSDVSAATEVALPVALPGRRDRVVWGLFHLDGQLILAADLRRLLRPAQSAPPPAQGHQGRFARMLILGRGADTFAAVVDDVPGTFRLSADPLQALPLTAPAQMAGLARGVLHREDAHVTVLDGTRLLAALAQDIR